MEQFQPNANNILDVLYNKKPKYLPLYEHHIDIEFIEKFTGEELIGYRETEPEYFFKKVTEFWKNNTYDAFDFEAPICDVFPEHGAIMGGKLGPIQTRSDFELLSLRRNTPFVLGSEQTQTRRYQKSLANRNESIWRMRVWHFRIRPRFGRLRESVYHAIHRSRLVPRPFYSYR